MSGGFWLLLNPVRIEEALADEPEFVRSAVLDALEAILNSPGPETLDTVRPLRGAATRGVAVQVWLARLPHDYVLSFSLHEDDVPPIGDPVLLARAFVKSLTGGA